MTFDELTKLLVELKLESTLGALRRAVLEESRALLDIKAPPHTARVKADALKQAQDYYAEDITDMLNHQNYELTPEDILCRRRIAESWAIARLIVIENPCRIC